MKRLVSIILALITAVLLTANVSAASVMPDILSAVLNEDGSVTVTISVRNPKQAAINGFALYDFSHKSWVQFGTMRVSLAKWLNVKINARTIKKIKIKIPASKIDGITAEDIECMDYRLYYSCWAGETYCYGRVDAA